MTSPPARPHASSLVGRPWCETALMFGRRTKIVATLGPATDPPEVLHRLVSAGMDCARLNCSHGERADLLRRTAAVRAAAERTCAARSALRSAGAEAAALGATETRALEAGDALTSRDRR